MKCKNVIYIYFIYLSYTKIYYKKLCHTGPKGIK